MLSSSSSSKAKAQLDTLFLLHGASALLCGLLAFTLPHVFEWFMIHHGESLTFRANSDPESKVTHLVVRMYGALILAQAWITHNMRQCEDAHARRSLVQAYFGVFLLTTVALLRAQLTPGGFLSAWNWLNILGFAALSAAYGFFAFVQKIAVFEGLGKAMS
jgi:hypothetical protein